MMTAVTPDLCTAKCQEESKSSPLKQALRRVFEEGAASFWDYAEQSASADLKSFKGLL